jgi:hypothetical protein
VTKYPNFFDATKPRQFTLILQITLLNCKFFSITGAPAFQTSNQSKGTVDCDWSKVSKAVGSLVLPKNFQFSRLIYKTV